MRAVVQRVASASVVVEGEVVGSCGNGLLAFVGAHRDDTPDTARKLADKVAGLRIFNDEAGKMNLSISALDPRGSVLAISNFTLYGDANKNRRPSFIEAAPFEEGKVLFDEFVNELRRLNVVVETGVFGAHMVVKAENDGPVTILLDVPPGPTTHRDG